MLSGSRGSPQPHHGQGFRSNAFKYMRPLCPMAPTIAAPVSRPYMDRRAAWHTHSRSSLVDSCSSLSQPVDSQGDNVSNADMIPGRTASSAFDPSSHWRHRLQRRCHGITSIAERHVAPSTAHLDETGVQTFSLGLAWRQRSPRQNDPGRTVSSADIELPCLSQCKSAGEVQERWRCGRRGNFLRKRPRNHPQEASVYEGTDTQQKTR